MASMDETGYIKRKSIKRQKVAIVGSGLAGLTTAHLLKKGNFDVEIFEMGSSPSLDAASMSVTYQNGGQLATERVDIPMRAFAGGYYTNLLAMYKYLKIPFRAQKFLFTFSRTEHSETNSTTVHVSGSHGLSRPNSDETPYFIHSSNNHRLPPVKPDGRSWFSYISEVLYLWIVYTYFTVCCFWFPPERKTFTTPVSGGQRIPTGKTESLREYLQRIHLPEYFVSNFLLALISSVTTCPHETLLDFPAADITGYKKYMHKQPHYMIQGGVCQIQERLLEGIKVGLNRKVLGVERVTTGAKQLGNLVLRWEETATGLVHEKIFDQVVLAVSPYVVGKIYKPLSRQMSRIPCCEAEVVAHYDERVIEGVIDPFKSSSPINEVFYEKQNTQSPYPSQKLNQLLHFSQRLLGNTDAHIIQLRTTTQPSSMIFHKSSTPWTLLNNGQSVPSLVTESTHIHPPGVLLTTSTIYPLKNDKVLRTSRFVRVLRTPQSRDVVQTIFRGKNVSVKKTYVDEKAEEAGDNGEEWRNGDDGVWLCGGWCWDGMVLLEGCVRSAMRIAVELGVEVPWKVEGSWEE